KAAGDNDGIAILQIVRIVPQHGGLLAGGGDGRVIAVMVAIGAREDDDAKFHALILSRGSNGLELLPLNCVRRTQRIYTITKSYRAEGLGASQLPWTGRTGVHTRALLVRRSRTGLSLSAMTLWP